MTPTPSARSLRLLITAGLIGLLVGAWLALGTDPRPSPDADLRRSGNGSPNQDRSAPEVDPPAIRVSVVDTLELPLTNASLQVLGADADSPAIASARTDSFGQAVIPVPPGRTLLLAVDHADFPSALLALGPLATDELRPIPIALGSRRGIAVRVTNERNQPIAAATVRATPGPRPDAADAALLARTDDTGVGTLSALGSGSWVLTIQAAGHELTSVPIRDGAGAPATLPVQLQQTGSIVGTVRDAATGRPSSRAEVRTSWSAGDERTARIVQGGTFSLPLPVGSAPPERVTIVIPDVGVWFGPAPANENWEFELPLSGRIVRGTVRDRGRPIEEAHVTATSDTASRGGRGFPWNNGWWTPQTRTGADGTFVLGAIPAGRFEVLATSEGRAAASGTLVDAAEPIPLSLASPGGLSGRVANRNGPTKDVMIEIFAAPAEPMVGPVASVRTDRRGRFATELTPGTYRIRATSPEGSWTSEAVAIAEGERRSLGSDIRLNSGHTVIGRVQDPGMADRGPALVTLVAQDPVLPSHRVRTAGDGTFSVDRIPTGTYSAFYSFPADPWAERASTAARSQVTLRVRANADPVLLQPIR